jgi:signal transduction histidine kinase
VRVRWWPGSLFGRVALILFFGLVVAHVLSFWLILREQAQTAMTMMVNYLPNDIAASVAILERVPAAERAEWLGRIERRNYSYALGGAPAGGAPVESVRAQMVIATIVNALGPAYVVTATVPANAVDPMQVRLHLQLHDGTPLTITLSPPGLAISVWVLLILSLQLAVLGLFTWIAVRLATRPLVQLARAADALGPDLAGDPLPEDGPEEVARAAVAFNAMQRRIKDHVAERMRILAAISHDLQTPIARMGLRADLLDDIALREKLHGDLQAMQVLVEEGIAYARSAHGTSETPCPIDLYALLDSLVCDYVDAGRLVRLGGRYDHPLTTRPHTLRRIIANLVDNALKFGKDVEILIEPAPADRVSIAVRDRGPGIPPAEIDAVLQPFYRVETSRNRQTGGTGLGLAIAQRLACALSGTLTLSNREGGGLEARVSLPDPTPSHGPHGPSPPVR